VRSGLNAIAAGLNVFSVPSIAPTTTTLNLGLTNINVLTGLTFKRTTPLEVVAGHVSAVSDDVNAIRTKALKVASVLNELQAELRKVAEQLRESSRDLAESSKASRESGKSLVQAGVALSQNG
jgi:septal ring factor EnvC (AmiA/AmiB activator)